MSLFIDAVTFRSKANLVPVLAAFLMGALALAPGQLRAQDGKASGDTPSEHEPTLGDYSAAMRRLAMAKVQAEIDQAKTGGSKAGPVGPMGPFVAPAPLQPVTSSVAAARPAADPTVIYVRPAAKGGLIASLALGDGGVIDATAGRQLGRGVVVQAVTVSEVTIKDSSGVRALSWSEGGAAGQAPAPASMSAFGGSPGVMGPTLLAPTIR